MSYRTSWVNQNPELFADNAGQIGYSNDAICLMEKRKSELLDEISQIHRSISTAEQLVYAHEKRGFFSSIWSGSDKKFSVEAEEYKEKIKNKEAEISMLEQRIKKLDKNIEEEKELREQQLKYALENSPLTNYFGVKYDDDADNILYYLKLPNGHYKVGITSSSVSKRYSGIYGYKVLLERRAVNARQVEGKIKQTFKHLVVGEDKHLNTKGTEIFSEDVLKLDIKG